MADLTYTVSSGGTNSGTSWTTINGAWNDVKNNNRMGAGAGVIPASSTFYIKISGNFATDATLFGLDVTASGAAINIGANTNAWNASTANAAGKSTSFDGFNMGSSDTFGLYSSQGGVTIQDIVIVGAINGSVAIVDIGGNATYPVTVKNCIIVGTATGKVVALKAWNSTVVKNTVIFLSNASQTTDNAISQSNGGTFDHLTVVSLGGVGQLMTAADGAEPTVRNSYVGGMSSTPWTSHTYNGGSVGNASSGTGTPNSGLNSVAFSTTNFVSVTGNGDFRVNASSALKTTGATRLAGTTTDAYGQSRADPATIGAAEPVSTAPVLTGPSGKQMTGGFFDLSGGTS